MPLDVYAEQGIFKGVATQTAPFEVLAEPTRRALLDQLLRGPCAVGELTERLGLSQPSTSKHLRVLREAGLVTVRRDAQRRWYELNPAPLAEIDAWLAPYRRLWERRLDALEAHLDTMDDDDPEQERR
ncbi:MAG: metalloregulator ArsR/SmtB family transcription factor [Streptosporangiales bacterium]|nr:metalloregulator ArsR/SmtB family transcription factor [Streptosporangiales bacterium]